jgi:peptidoglycan/xylan/chitin deacetylase (PgdA/CDA1 family)
MWKTHRPHVIIAKFPGNATCAVTTSWDDNDKDNMKIASVLDSFGLKGTFYIDFSDAKEHLSDSQIRELSGKHEVGSHTWSHADMRSCDESKIQSELTESRKVLEDTTGDRIFGLAYPYGHHTYVAGKIAKECGYIFARTTELGHVNFPPPDHYSWGVSYYALKRSGLPKKLISRHTISRTALVYLFNMTSKSSDLALKLLEKAMLREGVWHIYGHADEVIQPVHNEELIRICRHVAGQKHVWYTTNSNLFLNEIVKTRVSIRETQHDSKSVFTVTVVPPREPYLKNAPVPLRLLKPTGWGANFQFEVKSKSCEVGRSSEHVWIDLFDDEAELEVAP